MRGPRMVIGGEGEDVGDGNFVGRPDNLAHLEVPPHVGVIEARLDREHCKNEQKPAHRTRKREDPTRERRRPDQKTGRPDLNRMCSRRGSRAQAVPIS